MGTVGGDTYTRQRALPSSGQCSKVQKLRVCWREIIAFLSAAVPYQIGAKEFAHVEIESFQIHFPRAVRLDHTTI